MYDEKLENGEVYINGVQGKGFYIASINGEEVIEEKEYPLYLPGGFEVVVENFDREAEYFNMCLYGKSKMGKIVLKIYTTHNQYVCKTDPEMFVYYIPIKKIVEMSGSPNFKVYVDKMPLKHPNEIFDIHKSYTGNFFPPVVGIRIKQEADKKKYAQGESFDKTGLKVEAVSCTMDAQEITNYIIDEEDKILSYNDQKMVIRYDRFSVNHPIEVKGQKIAIGVKQYKRERPIAIWTEWSVVEDEKQIEVYASDTKEIRTVITIDWSLILDSTDQKGVRLKLKCLTANDQIAGNRIWIGGISHTIPDNGELYVYIGDIWTGKNTIQELEITYDNANLTFQKEELYEVYYCDAQPKRGMNQTTDFTFSEDTSLHIDLTTGTVRTIINDFFSHENFLGLDLNHIIDPGFGKSYYGLNVRLSIEERLEFLFDATSVKIPVYTNCYGEKEVYQIYYYYWMDGKKQELTDFEKNNLMIDQAGNLWSGSNQVYYDFIGSFTYLHYTKLPNQITSIPRYKELREREPFTSRPSHWLQSGAIYKGFDLTGKLVMIANTFGKYVEFEYDELNRIKMIKNDQAHQIYFSYDTTNQLLKKIIDYTTRKYANFYYFNDGSLKSLDVHCGMVYLDYCSSYHNGSMTSLIKLISVASVNKLYKLTYQNPSRFTSQIKEIKNENSEEKIAFEIDYLNTKIIENDTHQYIYERNEEGYLYKYYEINQERVIDTAVYGYNDQATSNSNQVITKMEKQYLNRFTMDELLQNEVPYNGFSQTTQYNKYHRIIEQYQTNIEVKENVTKSILLKNEYDDNQNLIQTLLQESYRGSYVEKLIIQKKIDYFYDDTYQVVTKKREYLSYFYEDVLTDKYTDVYDYLYDDAGNLIEECYYRFDGHQEDTDIGNASQLFISSKTEYDADKRIIHVLDATCKNEMTLEYNNHSLYPTGYQYCSEKVSYAHDPNDRIISIKGTEAIDNENKIVYSYNQIKQLNHSNNDPIDYFYDSKGRLSRYQMSGGYEKNIYYQEKQMEDWVIYDEINTSDSYQNKASMRVEQYGEKMEVYQNDKQVLNYQFDCDGNLLQKTDYNSYEIKVYTNDQTGLVKEIKAYKRASTTAYQTTTFSYDLKGRLIKESQSGTISQVTNYEYDNYLEDHIKSITVRRFQIAYQYDFLKRLTQKEYYYGSQLKITENYDYLQSDLQTETMFPIKLTHTLLEDTYTQEIEYDNHLNISVIKENGIIINRYFYDSLNRLIREDNQKLNSSKIYAYDSNGNRIKEECYHFRLDDLYEPDDTIHYEYDKDQLICYNRVAITYDEEGNLKQDQGHSLVWNKRHELKSYDETTFQYNAEGLRIKKSSNSYYYDEQERLLKESRGIEYFYDAEGLIGLNCNGQTFFYVKDILGNIEAIVSNTGEIQARYCYDAWGNHIVEDSEGNIITDQEHIGNINPFRYRSYYYDNETELYYLKSRYYNPKTGRFISKDNINYIEPMTVNGLNLYNYCGNDPVNKIDPTGHFGVSALIIGLITSVFATGLKDYLNDGKIFNGDVSGWEYLGSAVSGLLGGAVGQSGNIFVRVAGAIGSEIIGGLISENSSYSWSSLKNNLITGLVSVGIAEGLTIVGKKIAKSIYSRGFTNASQKGQKELSKFFKTGGKFKVTNKSALKVLDYLDKFIYCFEKLKDLSGNFYGFTVGVFGNLIEW